MKADCQTWLSLYGCGFFFFFLFSSCYRCEILISNNLMNETTAIHYALIIFHIVAMCKHNVELTVHAPKSF